MEPSNLTTINIKLLASEYVSTKKKHDTLQEKLKQSTAMCKKIDQVSTKILDQQNVMKWLESRIEGIIAERKITSPVDGSKPSEDQLLIALRSAHEAFDQELKASLKVLEALNKKLTQLFVSQISSQSEINLIPHGSRGY